MDRILSREISWCSPSGVSRSIFGDLPRLPGLRNPRRGLRSRRTTTTFLCVEVGWRFFNGSYVRIRPVFANLPDVCYVKPVFLVTLLSSLGLRPERRPLTEKKQILKSASIISLVTLFSRILGYVRDQRIALLLGTSLAADSFVLAYSIPNLFRRLVGEGSMTSSFIPVFTSYMRGKPQEEVWNFANRIFWTLALVLGVITVLGMVFSSAVIHLFTSASTNQTQWEQAVTLNRIIFPYIFFIGLSALAMGILNCFHKFGLPAATPILFNLSVIGFSTAGVWKSVKDPEISLAVGVLVGGALH